VVHAEQLPIGAGSFTDYHLQQERPTSARCGVIRSAWARRGDREARLQRRGAIARETVAGALASAVAMAVA